MHFNGRKGDTALDAVQHALRPYGADHAKARIEARRRSPWVVHLRIIDPDFKGVDDVDRFNLIWSCLEKLPESVASQVSLLLLLTPAEAKKSPMNLDFEDVTSSPVA